MAQFILGAAGAAVGFVIGGVQGAQIGWIAGSTVGGLLDPPSFSGPRLGDQTVTSSAYGATIPYLEGHTRLSGQVIWASTKRELAVTTSEGKGGSEYTSYMYEVDLHILLTENPIVDVTRVWSNGKLIWTRKDGATAESLSASDNTSRWSRFTVYSGIPEQMPDPDGHPNAPAYRGRGSVFIKDLGLGSSGAIPNLTFEVTSQGIVGGIPYGTLVHSGTGTLQKLDYDTGAVLETYPLEVNGTAYPTDWLGQAAVKLPNSNKIWAIGYDENAPDYNNAVLLYELDPFLGIYTRRFANLPGTYGSWLRASPDGQYLYIMAYDTNVITRVRASDGAVSTTVTLGQYNFVNSFYDRFEVSPDGTQIVVGLTTDTAVPYVYDSILLFLSTANGAVLHSKSLGPSLGDCMELHFSGDGARLNVCWGSLLVYNMSNYALLHDIPPSFSGYFNTPGAIAFNQDESVMYMGYAFWGKLDYYSLPSYSYIKTVNTTLLPNGEGANFLAMNMSADFKRIYVGDWDRDNVWCFDLETEARTDYFAGNRYWTMAPIILGSGYTTTFVDPSLREVVRRLCQRAGMGVNDFDVSALPNTPVHGLSVGQVSSTRAVLEQLANTYFFEARLSDKLYFIPRATAPVGTLEYNDLGVSETGAQAVEVLPLKQQDELEIPSQVAMTYICEAADYMTDTQYSDRLISSQVNTQTLQVPINFTSSEAKAIVDAVLQDRVFAALGTTVSVNMRHALYEPGDVLNLLDRNQERYVMRVVKKTESGITITYELVNDEASVLVQSGVTDAPSTSQTDVRPVAPTVLKVLNLPALHDADTTAPGFYLTVEKSGTGSWTGAAVDSSVTGTNWTTLGQFTQNTVQGTLTADLGAWGGADTLDFMNELLVNVGSGNSLASLQRDEFLADQSLNLAWVGAIDPLTGNNAGEVLRFQNASLVSAGVYRLSGLHRGLGNTEELMSHLAGEHFVLLSSAGVNFYAGVIADIGQQRYYRATTFGSKPIGLTPQPFSLNAANLRPYSPVDLRADRSSADTVFTWIRRTRLSTRFAGPIPVGAPLGESSEAYRVTVYGSSFTEAQIKRSVVVSSPSWTYTAAMQVADFGSAQSAVRVRVAQISSAVGDGKPLDRLL